MDWNNDQQINNTIENDEIIYDSGLNICQSFGSDLYLSFQRISQLLFVNNPNGLVMKNIFGDTSCSTCGAPDFNRSPCPQQELFWNGDVRDIVIHSQDTRAGSFTDPHFKYPEKFFLDSSFRSRGW